MGLKAVEGRDVEYPKEDDEEGNGFDDSPLEEPT